MVKGNWQRRIEQAEARKIVSKQNRQKKNNRANYKAMVSNCIKLLDDHRVPTDGTLHIWTETKPSHRSLSSSVLPTAVAEGKSHIRVADHGSKKMSTTEEDDLNTKQQQRRGRSGSFGEEITRRNIERWDKLSLKITSACSI